MKATINKINKSELFKNAWYAFRKSNGFMNFSECLKYAWRSVKSKIAKVATKIRMSKAEKLALIAEKIKALDTTPRREIKSAPYVDLSNYYSRYAGTYHGD